MVGPFLDVLFRRGTTNGSMCGWLGKLQASRKGMGKGGGLWQDRRGFQRLNHCCSVWQMWRSRLVFVERRCTATFIMRVYPRWCYVVCVGCILSHCISG